MTVRHRCVAGVSGFIAGAFALGAKVATLVLPIWMLAVLSCASLNPESRRRIWSEISKPSPPVCAALVLAVYAGVSALWANDPRAALWAALVMSWILLCGQALRAGLKALPPDVAVLVGGWFAIGLSAGSLLLLVEFGSGFAMFRWLLTTFPGLAPSHSTMLDGNGGNWVLLNRAIGNWSVAGINLLLWPTLLIVWAIATASTKWIFSVVVFALIALVTIFSEHQTSLVANFVSLAVFSAAIVSTLWTRRLMFSVSIALVLAVVPLGYFAGHKLQLQNASWAQFTLQERFKIWGNVSASVAKAPVFGIGADNTTLAETQAAPPPVEAGGRAERLHPHNMMLQIWLELGAIGAAIFLLAIVLLFATLRRVLPVAAPFALATVSMVTIEVFATWNIWSGWFLATLMLTLCLLSLAIRLATDAAAARSVTFTDIWLPQSLKFSRVA